MAVQSRGWCPDCRRYVLASRQATNHILHAILTLFFCGLWAPIWLIIAIGDSCNNDLCQRCGCPTE